MILSKATYKWGYYRSNQNQQKSNNMQVLLQIYTYSISQKWVHPHISANNVV